MSEVRFTKMHGLGNDYIYVDTESNAITEPSACSVEWSRYHTGIGSDGLVLIGKSKVADFSMRIFNADGSEARMCGNASRCIGKYVYDKHLTTKKDLTLETKSGIVGLHLITGKSGTVEKVTVDMGEPTLADATLVATTDGTLNGVTIHTENGEYSATFVSMGNPHTVIFTDDAEHIDVAGIGHQIEFDKFFPERTNVEFATILADGKVRMRVWERGSGITQACGTGACATAVASILHHLCHRTVTVIMDGGPLEIEWRESDNHVYMTGPACIVFEGTIEMNNHIEKTNGE